jgi:hypothetical protein
VVRSFFPPVICPLFYVETLADLEKAVRQGRSPEQEVGIVAQKVPEMSVSIVAHHDRWQKGEFLEVERRFAKVWRSALYSLDLMAVAAGIKALGIDPGLCKALEIAKELASSFTKLTERWAGSYQAGTHDYWCADRVGAANS